MMMTSQRTVVTQATPRPGQMVGKVALFNPDGTPFKGVTGFGAIDPVDEVDAVPSAAAPTKVEFDAVVALANALKATLNEVLTALKA